jgi:hypothetical protein
MLVIVPSRGRPQNIDRLIEAWKATVRGKTLLLIVTDPDDPEAPAYEAMQLGQHGNRFGHIILDAGGKRLRLGGILNWIGRAYATETPVRAIGFMGDDHVPRTEGWDAAVADALTELGSGIVYGNDLLQGERLPTAAFMTSDIIRTLRWMCPPGLEHLYIDDAWRELGQGMGRLRYLPDVVIEHLHPAAGKAQRDPGYDEANHPDQDQRDKHTFLTWYREELPLNLELLRARGLC